uniref:Copia protein n=1 Tax=Cajanus cajan TaxID=3821 RepID=A0A151S3U5_CAJCA|nr:Copia protein [Cajanus cajan]
MSNRLEQHWIAIKRILWYLQGTISLGLHSIHAYCDANWAFDPNDRRSRSPNLVSWWSKKQTVVARSSTEAEYRSSAAIIAKLIWIQTLLFDLHVSYLTPVILSDNMSTVALAHNPVLHTRTKHMELYLFFVHEKVTAKKLQVVHVTSIDQ